MGMFDSLLGLQPTHLCKSCGNRVRPQISSKINGCFLIVLLLLFIIPGILYLVWAGTQRVYTCPKCKAQNTMVPLNSPEAERMLSTSKSESGAMPVATRVERECPWCAEPILAAAKVCKHCGRDVSAVL